MSVVLEAILPIAAMIFSGWTLRRLAPESAASWPVAEKLVYYFLFPCLLFANAARADFDAVEGASVVLVAALPLASLGAAMFLGAKGGAIRDRTAATLAQAGLRANVYVGVALAETFFRGAEAAAMAIAIAIGVPLVNALGAWLLARDAEGGGLVRILRALARNPLIIACVAGLAAAAIEFDPGPIVWRYFDIAGAASLGLALLCVGAALELRRLRRFDRQTAAAVLIKLVVLPALAWALALAIGLDRAVAAAVVAYHALPTSAAAYIHTREEKGDAERVAAAVTAATLASALTLTFWLLLGRWLTS